MHVGQEKGSGRRDEIGDHTHTKGSAYRAMTQRGWEVMESRIQVGKSWKRETALFSDIVEK